MSLRQHQPLCYRIVHPATQDFAPVLDSVRRGVRLPGWRECEMARHRSSTPDLVAEMLSAEFLGGGVAYSTLEALHRGEIDDWLALLDRSDLLGPDEARTMADTWR